MEPRNRSRQREALESREAAHIETLLRNWERTVPGEYVKVSLEQILASESLGRGVPTRVSRYVKDPSKFLLLHGPKGVGKSTMGVGIVSRLISSLGVAATFTNFVTLTNDFSFRLKESDPLDAASSAPILMIDDLGSMNDGLTSFQERMLWALIEARWSREGRYTILTTNMAIQSNRDGIGLAEWLGDSAWDRISDDLVRIEMKGDSHRGI